MAAKNLHLSLAAAFLLIYPTFLKWIFPEFNDSFFPSMSDSTFGIAALWITSKIKSPALIVAALSWLAWYVLGMLNLISSSLFLGQHYAFLETSKATNIFLMGCFSFSAGIYFGERYFQFSDNDDMAANGTLLDSWGHWILLLFPVFWLLSLYLKLGYLPIFSGENITESIYELDYGVLYPFTMLLAYSALYLLELLLSKRIPSYWLIYLVLIVAISLVDSKRFVAITFAAAAVPLLFLHQGNVAWKNIFKFAIIFVTVYVGTQILRQGGDTERLQVDTITKYMSIGVEFRDFVFSVNYFTPGNIPDYDWLKSTFASMANSSLLSFFEISKADYVQLGSAFAWAQQFKSPYGIRTGIVSELWFAYEYFGFILILGIGFLMALTLNKIKHSSFTGSRVFYSAVFGLLLTGIVGQSTALFGSITVLFYFLLLLLAEKVISARKIRLV